MVFDALGNLRCEIARRYQLADQSKYNLLWVTEFPLLEYDAEENRYVAKHHPFTSPMEEDLDLLETQPGKVRAKAYDIILNGVELGGGSIRILTAICSRECSKHWALQKSRRGRNLAICWRHFSMVRLLTAVWHMAWTGW